MAVRIRLQRHGKKRRPFYRLVAVDSRSQRDGRFIERIGHYDPMTDPANIVIDAEKALKWLRTGAQPSDTAKDLMSKAGVWEQFINEKQGQPTPTPETESMPASEEDSDAAAEESAPAEESAEEAN
ncbi:30S ribosomal protein S16 [Candidatus Poribacteria bacterium]|nr:30S ribosomal protein S16 [Candidatus Poribacteria bacterium]